MSNPRRLIGLGLLVVLVSLSVWLWTRPRATQTAPARAEPRPLAPAASGPIGTASPVAPATAPLPRVDGVVRDAMTGAPVAAVDVLFSLVGGPAGEVTATSAADGLFALALAPGRYRVRASGLRLHGFAAADLSVGAGARVTGFELRVVRLASIEGRVVDGAGQPLAGASLGFSSRSPRGRVNGADVEGGQSESNPSGLFELVVAPGEVEVTASLGGRRGRLLLPYVEPGAIVQGAEVVVEEDAVLSGVVRGPKGELVADAQVVAVARPGPGGQPGRAEARSDTDGRFQLAGLPAGRVRLEARARGYASAAPSEADAPGEGVVVMLRAAAAIHGRVLDPDGQPLPGVKVSARRGGSVLPAPETRSDETGAFVLGDLGPGPWDVVAELAGYAPVARPGVAAPAEGILLRMAAPGGLAGMIRRDDGKPVVDFEVRWRPIELSGRAPIGGGRLHFFAADGAYRVEGLAPGNYEVAVRASGRAGVSRRIDIAPGAFADGSFTLAAGASLVGRVTSKSGQPVAAARIEVLTGGADDQEIRSDADGRFQLDDVAPGRRSLSFEHPGYVGKSETGLELRAGERRQVDVTLTPLTAGEALSGGRPMEFAGIGAVLGVRGGEVYLGSLVPGGPADRSGLAVGDVVESVAGIPCKGRSLADITEDIRGVAGTVIRLQLRRGENHFSVDVVRGTVRYGG